MKLPGFTAENSVGPTVQIYRVQDRYRSAAAASLHPQVEETTMDDAIGDDLADDGGEGMAAETGDDAEDDGDAGNGEEPEGEEDLDEAEEA